MSKKDKLLKKFLEIPIKKDLTFNDLETLLLSLEFIKLEGSGSAVKFFNKEKDILINLHKPHPDNELKVISFIVVGIVLIIISIVYTKIKSKDNYVDKELWIINSNIY